MKILLILQGVTLKGEWHRLYFCLPPDVVRWPVLLVVLTNCPRVQRSLESLDISIGSYSDCLCTLGCYELYEKYDLLL